MQNNSDQRHGKDRLAIPDCLIAATAIISDMELFAYNTKDFKFIKELKLFYMENS